MENCQLNRLNSFHGKPSHLIQHSCNKQYIDFYRGNQNITVSGKTCLRWDTFSYLSAANYPRLTKNYCRNPQGYGKLPWCYTSYTRNWEYCVQCHTDNSDEERDEDFSKTTIISICGVVVLIFLLVSVCIYWIHCKKRNASDIDPYCTCDINSQGGVTFATVNDTETNK